MSGTGGVSHRKASTAVLAPLHRNIIPISSTIQTILLPPRILTTAQYGGLTLRFSVMQQQQQLLLLPPLSQTQR
jgi:hypothetical protein